MGVWKKKALSYDIGRSSVLDDGDTPVSAHKKFKKEILSLPHSFILYAILPVHHLFFTPCILFYSHKRLCHHAGSEI
jgi:hypothetical protein